jgi:hypothetical protein
MREGPAGLWEALKEKFTDLAGMIIDSLKSWVITQIVWGAVKFLLSLFNPVAALFKAIKLIIDVVMFFVNNIDRILKLIEAIVQSLGMIVAGTIQPAADWIETAMARMVTVIVSFLAQIFGFTGIADRIRGVIRSIQTRVDAALDWLVDKALAGVRFVAGKVTTVAKKGAAAAKAGVAAVKRFLFPSRTFQAGKVTHRLFFESDDPAARVMVASETRGLRAFVAGLARRKDKKPGTDQAIATIRDELDVIDAQRALLGSEPAKAAARIGKALDAIAKLLRPLLADEDTGTVANPYEVTWPKRALAQYDRLYIGPRVGEDGPRIAQDDLAEAHGSKPAQQRIAASVRQARPRAYEAWKARGFAVEVFDPRGKRALPEGGETIGVDPIWETHQDRKFELHPGSKSGGGGKINAVLRPYGWSPSAEGRDGDHVLERQMGGADALENLWPLDLSENRGAGATLAGAELKVPGDPTPVPMETVKTKARRHSVWIVMTRHAGGRRRL